MNNLQGSLPKLFLSRAGVHPNRPAVFYRDVATSRYTGISWLQLQEKVQQSALGLYGLGVKRGDRVGILAENCPQWIVADLGILSCGAVVVPIYPTSSAEDTQFIIENAGISVLFLSTAEHLSRLSAFIANSKIKTIILFHPHPPPFIPKEISFLSFLERGRCEKLNNEKIYSQLVASVEVDDLATLIYTSGTTGPPKGVMLSHRNFLENAKGASERIQISPEDASISFLPLSHVFERLAGYYFMIAHGASIAYAQNMQTVVNDMHESRPTVACAVPRFYEKFYARVIEKVGKASNLQRKIFHWAMALGKKRLQYQNKKLPFTLALQYGLARLLVFNKIKRQLGGRLRFFISGGAPLSKELAEFFYALDILILEGYGLTETSPVIAVNSPEDFKFGTVGRPLSNVEVRIAPDGEILTRGACVMQGYYQNPAATREAIQDGWFHTGDIGQFTPEGFLQITDRKKDIIKTSGGKMVSPQNIEGRILADPLFSQAIVLGDKRNYLVALLVPNRLEVEAYAGEKGIVFSSWEAVLKDPAILVWIDGRFRQRTEGLASFEQIKYYALLPDELSLAAGEITPTLKVKRRVVCEKYKDLIEDLYRRGEPRTSEVYGG